VGGGLMGKEFASAAARWMHLADIGARPVIAAICDPSQEARSWFTRHIPSIECSTSSVSELLNEDLDAVYCAVPHNLHEEVYTQTLAAGKHLFAEKPFGIDLGAARRIVDAILPGSLVRCSSEFPYFPAAQRLIKMIENDEFGEIIEVRASFLHCSDLDPNKPINWKRQVATNGEYGCMGDLGLHVVHIPARFGWKVRNVRALLSKIVHERPDGKGGMAPCETWDNAVLACESEAGFPMIFETKRISPGDTNTWSIRVLGTRNSAEFSTKFPKTLRTMPYLPGGEQAWRSEDVGHETAYKSITGNPFEFGFSDAILQMWAAFVDELNGGTPAFRCATPEEALESHYLFTAALKSQKSGTAERVDRG
jgi:predicted dehydrogenase